MNFEWTGMVGKAPKTSGDILYVSVSPNDVSLSDENCFKAAESEALNFVLDYHFFQSGSLGPQFLAESVKTKEYYQEPMVNSKPVFLIQIDRKKFFETFTEKKQATEILSTDIRRVFQKEELRPIFSFLEAELKKYEAEFLAWEKDVKKSDYIPSIDFGAKTTKDGKTDKEFTTKFKAETYIRDLRALMSGIDEFLGVNQSKEYVTLTLVFQKEDFYYTFKSAYADDVFLSTGLNVFEKIANSNKKILKIASNINKTPSGKYEITDSKDWKDFLNKYIVQTPSSTLYQIDEVKQTYDLIKKGYDKYKKFPRSVKIPGISTINFDMKLKRIGERNEISDSVIDNIVRDFQFTFPTLETVEELLEHIIHKIPLSQLIAMLKRCLGGFGFDWNFDWNFKFPEIPNIDIYDLYLFLSINFEEIWLNIMKRAIDSIFKYLMDMITKFCQDMWKPDAGSLPGLDLSNMPDYGSINDALQQFIKEVFDSLTANQICSLLNGEPSEATLFVIETILRKPVYQPLRQMFQDRSEIVAFFANLGTIIDKSIYCEYVEEQFSKDPCTTKEVLRSLTKQVYQENHDFPDDIIENLLDFQEKSIANLQEGLQSASSVQNLVEETMNSSLEQEIPLAGGKNGNVFSKMNEGTFKICESGLREYERGAKELSGMIAYQDRTEPDSIGTVLEKKLRTVSSPVEEQILRQLYFGGGNGLSLPAFIEKINLTTALDSLKTQYIKDTKSINSMKNEDQTAVQIEIVNKVRDRIAILKDIIVNFPIDLAISRKYRFNEDDYLSIIKTEATSLESFIAPELLEEAKSIYESLSTYTVRAENMKDPVFVKLLSSLTKNIDDFMSELESK